MRAASPKYSLEPIADRALSSNGAKAQESGVGVLSVERGRGWLGKGMGATKGSVFACLG